MKIGKWEVWIKSIIGAFVSVMLFLVSIFAFCVGDISLGSFIFLSILSFFVFLCGLDIYPNIIKKKGIRSPPKNIYGLPNIEEISKRTTIKETPKRTVRRVPKDGGGYYYYDDSGDDITDAFITGLIVYDLMYDVDSIGDTFENINNNTIITESEVSNTGFQDDFNEEEESTWKSSSSSDLDSDDWGSSGFGDYDSSDSDDDD